MVSATVLGLILGAASAAAGILVVLLVGGDQIRGYLERRRIARYVPIITDVWAEGTVLYGPNPAGGSYWTERPLRLSRFSAGTQGDSDPVLRRGTELRMVRVLRRTRTIPK